MADDSLQEWLAAVGKKHGFTSGDPDGDAGAAPGGGRDKAELFERLKQIDRELEKLTAFVDQSSAG